MKLGDCPNSADDVIPQPSQGFEILGTLELSLPESTVTLLLLVHDKLSLLHITLDCSFYIGCYFLVRWLQTEPVKFCRRGAVIMLILLLGQLILQLCGCHLGRCNFFVGEALICGHLFPICDE